MALFPASHLGPFEPIFRVNLVEGRTLRSRLSYPVLAVLCAALFAASIGSAQTNSKVSTVDPATGKVNDSITVSGENLGKAAVSGVFLSDDKQDYKATVTDQADDKIVMKVPQVKAGDYNISIQTGNRLLIQPVRFTVQ